MRIVRVAGTPDALLLNETAGCIEDGGTIIFPTDTVYGIGCAAENDGAVESIFAAKRRPAEKPLAIHLASPDLVDRYARRISPAARALVEKFWPGPLTIIVERRDGVCEAAARGGATIALRCPDDETCRALDTSERAVLTELLTRIAADQGLTPGVHPGYRTLRPPAAR